MADEQVQVGNNLGVAARGGTGGTNINGGNNVGAGLDDDDCDTINAMRARLAAIDAGFYTAAKMNSMTMNDMAYAIRVNDNAGTI